MSMMDCVINLEKMRIIWKPNKSQIKISKSQEISRRRIICQEIQTTMKTEKCEQRER